MPTGCGAGTQVYTQVDCDEDGILDHTCHDTSDDNRWLVLSSEGCLNNWGSSARSISECQTAWSNEGKLGIISGCIFNFASSSKKLNYLISFD